MLVSGLESKTSLGMNEFMNMCDTLQWTGVTSSMHSCQVSQGQSKDPSSILKMNE